jgi:hypothetical protein
MKTRNKKLLSVLGAIGLIAPMVGCEADAEETSPSGTNASVTAAAAATGEVSGPSASTNVDTVVTAGETNAEDGTNILNQQTTVVMKIPPTLPPDVTLTKGAQEVVKLLQSGVSETVVLLFIEKTTESFDLDAADIVYLNDIGVPPTVLAAMLNHDGADADVLHDALGTNELSVATAPPGMAEGTNEIANLTAAAPPVEVSSNYVAAPQYGGTVVAQDPAYDPNAAAQQQVVVDQQPVVVQQPAVVVTQPAVTYSYFYDSLSPYGSWVFLNDYGWCWQPTIAVTHRTWRPYLHGGRWLHSDVGWYWHSDYSWGWAPFHYGRWHSAPRIGWVWTPDYTWGPSWVTWRRSRDYCGWAPLPPRARVRPGVGFSYWGRDVGFNFSFGYSHDYYTFVPTRRFCDRRVLDHVVPSHRTVNIYKDSTVVNNYIVGNNNTIINNGIGRDYVASHTRNEIPRVRVAEAAASKGRIAPDRLVRQGAETVVFRPQRPAPKLVEAHEAAVARTRARAEVARPDASGSDPLEMRRNMIGSRPNTERPSTDLRARSETGRGSGGTRPGTGSGSGTLTRPETARPQLSRNDDIPTPVFGTPAPVGPEPDRSAEILRARTAQESRVRSGATVRSGGSGEGTPSVIRPNTTTRVPTFTRPQGGSTMGTLPQGSSRSGAPEVSTSPRSETGRGSIAPSTPTRGAQTPVVRPGTSRPTTTTPSGRSVPANRPATSPGVTRPTQEQGRPTTTLPSGRTLNNAPAASPSFSRPAQTAQTPSVGARSQLVRPAAPAAQSPAFARPSTSQSAPVTRTIPNNSSVQTVRPSTGTPTWRQSTIQQGASQPIQRSTPSVQSPPTTARPIQRSESFSRPATPVQRSVPAPRVVQPQQRMTPVQPQRVAPSAPVQRPAIRSEVSRSYSAPVRSAPSVRSAPVARSGPVVRSAPSSRSTTVSRPSSGGRGRVEVGR